MQLSLLNWLECSQSCFCKMMAWAELVRKVIQALTKAAYLTDFRSYVRGRRLQPCPPIKSTFTRFFLTMGI